jgi:regulator of protease activity HflC (stomatin/prohibitin superfamily)
MKSTHAISSLVGGILLVAALALAIVWGTCRVYVPQNQCLVLIRKTGTPLPAGEKIAGPGQKGIQRETLGPGRYFFNPWVWDWELHDLVEISAGDPNTWREYYAEAAADTAFPDIQGGWPQIGLLVNKVGKPAPAQNEVVEAGYQGIQRDVLTPGTYRINPYVYEVKLLPATVVPLGCCGVVTSQLGDMPGVETVEDISVGPDGQPVKGHPKVIQKMAEKGQRGVLKDVLPPGIYYLNPYVYRVQIVQVGYNQISQMAYRTKGPKGADLYQNTALFQVQPPAVKGSKSPAPKSEVTGGRSPWQRPEEQQQQLQRGEQQQLGVQDMTTVISFPSKDGFTINVDVTVVWGRHPAHIAEMINRFGDLEKLKAIILSQMRSICRNLGSEYESTDFIRGEQREQYQRAVTETLQRVCRDRDIDILIALIHNIEVHGSPEAEKEGMDLKKTIQRGYIAREQDLTKQAQRETAKVRAELETAKMAVEVARETISAETRKKVAEIKATGEKQAQETLAQRDLEVARIEKQIAELDAESTRLLGKANADVEQLRNQAEADGKRLMVEAFGSGSAFNLYTFAEGFSPESIRLIFAGPGTFWTDLSRLDEAASAKLLETSTEK